MKSKAIYSILVIIAIACVSIPLVGKEKKFSTLKAVKMYNVNVGLEVGPFKGKGKGGLRGVSYECKLGLSKCDTDDMRIVLFDQ